MTNRTISWNTPYTFSGKEKDVETGYGYFGARYYDSGLSIWLSVDPMSDKYPSLSPYNYCANNPVILVDPDGSTPKDPPSGKGGVDLLELASGLAGVVAGGSMWVLGSAAIISGVGLPAGICSLTASGPVMGYGVAKIIDAFDGGKRDIPSSTTGVIGRTVEYEFKLPKGSIEQPADFVEGVLTFNPKSTTETAVMVTNIFVLAMDKNQNNQSTTNNNNSSTNKNQSNTNNNQSKQKSTTTKVNSKESEYRGNHGGFDNLNP